MVTQMIGRVGTNPLNLTVHNNTYTSRLQIGSYIDCELTQEFGFHLGGGQLRVPADHPLAMRIMQADYDVVPITASSNGWRWTGRVKDYVAEGKPGREVLTAELVDDKIQLVNVLAYASPRSGLSIQSKRDYQVGRLESVVHHYLSENIAREGIPAYIMLPPPRSRDRSPRVDVSARMTNLDNLLRDVLDEHDYTITTEMWWPGEPFPPGKMAALVSRSAGERRLALRRAELDQTLRPDGPPIVAPTVPGLIVKVHPVRDRPWVRFSTRAGDVEEFRLSGRSPGPAKAVVGGKSDDWVNELLGMGIDMAVQGILMAIGTVALGPIGMLIGAQVGQLIYNRIEDTIFAFTSRMDVQRAANMGPFHLRESYTPSNSGVFTYDTSALAERELLDNKGGQAIEITVADGRSKILGNDQPDPSTGKIRHGYLLGDRVNFHEHLSGAVVNDIITGITVTDEHEQRVKVTPRIGKRKNTSNKFLDFTTGLNKIFSNLQDLSLAG